MIKTIELKNFKNHLDTKITLDDSCLHALVGPNSSGKTSVLQALYYLTQLTERQIHNFFIGEREPQYLTTSGKKESKVTVGGKSEKISAKWSASFFWNYSLSENGFVPDVAWNINGSQNSGDLHFEGHFPTAIWTVLNNTTYLKFSAEKLAQASYSEEVSPKIGYNGTGLAPALDSMKYEAPENFDDLQKFLKQIVHDVQEIGIRRAKVSVVEQRSIDIDETVLPFQDRKELTGQEVVFNMTGGERIPAHAMSEGTVIALGILAVLMSQNRPNLLLLDDIEQGLHPKAQIELVKILKKIIDMNPDLQIIFTTHSPYIIDELEPSQVHVLNTTPEGYATVKRMDEHPGVQRGLEVLTTGEFWDAEGEEWILAGETSG